MKRAQPEYALQCRVVDYLAAQPCVGFFHHSPNGSKLHGSQEQRQRTGARLKRAGTVAGYPDLTLYASDGRIGHLELKSEKGRLSDSQIHVQQQLTALGHHYAIVKHTDDVGAALREWGWM